MNSYITKDLGDIIRNSQLHSWNHHLQTHLIPEYYNLLWTSHDSPGWRFGQRMKINWRCSDLYSLKHHLDIFCIYNIHRGCYCTVLPNRYFYTSGHLRNAI